ncbi:MAG: hypothetical protein ACFE8E_10555 [Candidatus Hodarchaeota archaeon]
MKNKKYLVLIITISSLWTFLRVSTNSQHIIYSTFIKGKLSSKQSSTLDSIAWEKTLNNIEECLGVWGAGSYIYTCGGTNSSGFGGID